MFNGEYVITYESIILQILIPFHLQKLKILSLAPGRKQISMVIYEMHILLSIHRWRIHNFLDFNVLVKPCHSPFVSQQKCIFCSFAIATSHHFHIDIGAQRSHNIIFGMARKNLLFRHYLMNCLQMQIQVHCLLWWPKMPFVWYCYCYWLFWGISIVHLNETIWYANR